MSKTELKRARRLLAEAGVELLILRRENRELNRRALQFARCSLCGDPAYNESPYCFGHRDLIEAAS